MLETEKLLLKPFMEQSPNLIEALYSARRKDEPAYAILREER